MFYFLKFVFIFVLIFTLSGCISNKQSMENGQQEILLAHDCGFDYLPCCKDNPICNYGQKCCIDPNNKNRNYCADECTCGHEKEFCCKDEPKCQDNLRCWNGNCVECGHKNQLCCEEEKKCSILSNEDTKSDLICYNNKCLECGLPNNPCCPTGNECLNQKKIDETRTECINGLCLKCGSNGEKSCSGELKCIQGNLYNNEICYRCGEINQPCCDVLGTDTNNICNKNLECVFGFCSDVSSDIK